VTTFQKHCTREVALERLAEAGWKYREEQTPDSDFEDFVRASGKKGLLLVDFAFGRFILDAAGDQKKLLTHNDDAEGDPEYDTILHALFEGEVVA